jgi:transposase
MITYETFCQIKDLHQRQGLNAPQIATALGLHRHTVAKWLAEPHYRPRHSAPRRSKLDPYKADIVRWLDSHPLSAAQIFQRLREQGYDGGYSILTDYVRQIRPPRPPAYLKLAFAPGECAQVDWGRSGTLAVGATQRRLSFFVMVLCYSRLMYLEFTLSQTLEHFLSCHENALRAFGGGVKGVMIDNLKSAVLQRPRGEVPVFHPRYLELANHFGFTRPCAVGKGNEKGRVENGVGYIKKNFLNGLEITDLSALNLAAQQWLETVANVRIHGATRQRPVDRFEQEKPHLLALPEAPFDSALIKTVRASNQFRISFDANRYSVPAEYASRRVLLKAYPDRLCLYDHEKLIARHRRCYERHRDIEDPEHPRALLAQRRHAREHKLLARFLALSPQAEA